MLRYKTETRPGLVALYDIRPGNGAGPFLQPRSPHGAPDAINDTYGWQRYSNPVLLGLPYYRATAANCLTILITN